MTRTKRSWYGVEKMRKKMKKGRMVRILAPAMKDINPDLRFTTEIQEDFRNNRLPTLDCSLWLEPDMTIVVSYFCKFAFI